MTTDVSRLSEFEIIRQYFSAIGPATETPQSSVVLSGGDDCAVLSIPSNSNLVISLDTLVSGVHFPLDAAPDAIAQRALAVAISDLAAMGAQPLAFTLGLTIPEVSQNWLEKFSAGLHLSANDYRIPLVGGDTTRGPLSITIQVHGVVTKGHELKRSGAKVGDAIFVSGTLGDGAAALDIIQKTFSTETHREYFFKRFYQPRARIELGLTLRPIAHAAIDVSDGLLADVAHIGAASAVGIEVDSSKLPYSQALLSLVHDGTITEHDALTYALSGGDDYELCFTVPTDKIAALKTSLQGQRLAVTEIGRVVAGVDVKCFDELGSPVSIKGSGYRHF